MFLTIYDDSTHPQMFHINLDRVPTTSDDFDVLRKYILRYIQATYGTLKDWNGQSAELTLEQLHGVISGNDAYSARSVGIFRTVDVRKERVFIKRSIGLRENTSAYKRKYWATPPVVNFSEVLGS